ncbi:peptidoglycan-binding protein [Rugosibacter aromaticivorans]|uniref:Peptidoglycan-associated lipoprotein n=1 Tax=Rugosibacter aromaticivorans TaxID=1565605 RepID=A0A0C5JJX0_9PROT|nr:peptidoglycan-associated lipoprotein Pal [Rugosibacter aromaticivorans]AJP47611.1 peptidoglycan-binding protein [Rugosibacter aromaticivorans]TBR13952.1 MAG: peptidoglycan-associated lipoprotein Pal [Rugosibacter sp.]
MRTVSLLSTIALTLLLSACGSQPPAPEQNPSGVESRTPAAVEPAPTTSKIESFDPMSVAALKDPRSPLSKRSIYFDYDSYVVKDEYQTLLATHGKFLAANPNMKMLIQGNADERGSREYNLALGQKRAEAIKKSLSLLGTREDQLEAVSLGKEKPTCSEFTEECWAKNRRGDMLYSGEF